MRLPFVDENKTEHNIKENVSVAWEYAAIGEMIHQALGESRIIHERETSKDKKETNPDVEKIKSTAKEFLKIAFKEYSKERAFRFLNIMISKIFFTLYLALMSVFLILLLLFKSVILFSDIQIILFILAIIVMVIFITLVQLQNKILEIDRH